MWSLVECRYCKYERGNEFIFYYHHHHHQCHPMHYLKKFVRPKWRLQQPIGALCKYITGDKFTKFSHNCVVLLGQFLLLNTLTGTYWNRFLCHSSQSLWHRVSRRYIFFFNFLIILFHQVVSQRFQSDRCTFSLLQHNYCHYYFYYYYILCR